MNEHPDADPRTIQEMEIFVRLVEASMKNVLDHNLKGLKEILVLVPEENRHQVLIVMLNTNAAIFNEMTDLVHTTMNAIKSMNQSQ